MHVYLQSIYVKFVYQGHRVKVKITGTKKLHNDSCKKHNGLNDNETLTEYYTSSGIASYGALGHVPPRLPTISFLVHFRLNLTTNYPRLRAVCDSSLRRCQQLTAHTALITKLLVIEQLLHPAQKSAVSAPWPILRLCPSSQQILATPLYTRWSRKTHIVYCTIILQP